MRLPTYGLSPYMGEKWWNHSFNPWMGCTKVSPACKNCYAEAGAKRFGQAEWGPGATRQIVSDPTWKRPIKWNREAEEKGTRARVFCASWADIFEDRPELDAPRARLFALIERTPHLDWLLTTKRPQNIARMIPPSWRGAMPKNVWLGKTTESQKYADERIPHLIECRAVVTFVSVEPQLGPIDLSGYLGQLDWVICGGESGSRARPTQVAWARSIRDQCRAAGVSFFFKQWGQHAQIGSTDGLIRLRTKNERLLDGQSWDEYPTPRTKGRSTCPSGKRA